MISELTCARKSIASIPSVARAGVTPLIVVASCTGMTPVSASSAFIHIWRSQVIAIGRKVVNTDTFFVSLKLYLQKVTTMTISKYMATEYGYRCDLQRMTEKVSTVSLF